MDMWFASVQCGAGVPDQSQPATASVPRQQTHLSISQRGMFKFNFVEETGDDEFNFIQDDGRREKEQLNIDENVVDLVQHGLDDLVRPGFPLIRIRKNDYILDSSQNSLKRFLILGSTSYRAVAHPRTRSEEKDSNYPAENYST